MTQGLSQLSDWLALAGCTHVATNTLGLSGRLRLSALTEGGTEPEKIALLAKGKLKANNAQLKQALIGSLNPIQRFLLKELLL